MLVRRPDTEIKLIKQSVFPLFRKTKSGFKFRSIDVCIGLRAAVRRALIKGLLRGPTSRLLQRCLCKPFE